jgi:very-short-patch-repair endonuclease/predicted transcriptional regulator of viral defense system
MPDHGRKSGAGVRFLGHDRVIVALATEQHSVLELSQLVEIGFSPSGVQKRADAGRLHRIHSGVYSLVPRELLTREGHWMAAVLACGPGAVLSHRTAAALHELRGTYRTNIDVSVPRRSGRQRPGLDIHRSSTLTPLDVTRVKNIPCTAAARTHLDLAAVVARRSVERALDQWDTMGEFDLRALHEQLERNPRHRGALVLRSVLDEHYVGSTVTESELEEAFLALCRRLGLREPQVNRWIDLGDGEPMIRGDFVWAEERVIVETDGVRFHGTHQARERDPRRDQRAILAGWTPVRTTGRQVTRRPRELEPTLLRLVGRHSEAGNGSPTAGDVRAPRRPEMPPAGGSSASVLRAGGSP